MEGLQAIAQALDVGGNVALLVSVYYIYQSEKANRNVAERLARIEAKLTIEPQPIQQEK